MSLLSVSGLSLTLNGQQILRDVSFEVAAGGVIGLIGPNGSGKTTLFNVLSGFLKPTAGQIVFKGEEVTGLPPSRRAQRGIGRVFQNFGIFREMTLMENVLVALEALPKHDRQKIGSLAKVAEETLALVGLAERASEKAGSLSGGQMRLLEIARTLAAKKELFLLDEPTAGVAPKMTADVAKLIHRLKEEGRTVLIIEHDLPFIAKVCDRVLVLDVGAVVLTGTPEEVHRSPKLRALYFGADPTE